MAIEDGSKPHKKPKRKSPSLRFFYLNGDLHKVLSVSKPQDFAICWNFVQHKRVGYVWSDVRRSHKRAFSMMEVSKMINRTREAIERDILRGNIKPPQRTYSLDGNKRPMRYKFSEKDIYDLHDYMLSQHHGRPRKDGGITPLQSIPSRAQLRAMMEHNIITYVKTEDGEFVPVWKEQDW